MEDFDNGATSEELVTTTPPVSEETSNTTPDSPPADSVSTEPAQPKTRRELLEEALTKAAEKPEGTEPITKAEGEPTGATGEEKPSAPAKVKAPQSWTPAAREKFLGLDPDLQQEVLKRETEINRRLEETAQERKIAEGFMRAASPYEAHFRSIGVNPIQAAADLFNAGYVLHTGSAQAKANLLANFVKQFNIDLDTLDTALAQSLGAGGHGGSVGQPAGVDPALMERLNRIEQTVTGSVQEKQRLEAESVNKTISDFAADPKNEFFNDVAQHMVALLQAGTAKDLKDAYDQACWANPSVRKVLTNRQASNAQRLKAGNASMPSTGPRGQVNGSRKQFKSIREALVAAMPGDERV